MSFLSRRDRNPSAVSNHELSSRSNEPDTDAAPRSITHVDPDLFVQPVRRLDVSGGTAPFFELRLRCPSKGRSVDRYIGKDLSHATDEIDFYEKMLSLKRNPGRNADLLPLLEFAFEYAGVLSASEVEAPSETATTATTTTSSFSEPESAAVPFPAPAPSPPLELLVLRNLREGKKKLRMLDVKMGQKTAQAGWQGKTRLRAMKQGILDAATNSTTEGFRLEGFDGAPVALLSKEPFMDALPLFKSLSLSDSKLACTLKPGDVAKKKASRMMLQHMRGNEVFRHFVDLHMDFTESTRDVRMAFDDSYEPIELGEIVLHEVVERLTRLLVSCFKSPVPQKWIGSSVALGYDVGYLPRRNSTSEEEIRSSVLVNIFDWGRSELGTVEDFDAMTDAEKEDRRRFWKFYTDGVKSLSWNAVREYRNRFSNADAWEEVQFRVFDYDSMSKDDFMCQATVPATETKETWIPLRGRLVGFVVKGTMSYSIEWHDAPSPNSRLRGWYRLFIGKGRDMPIMDMARGGQSDPYCVITARSRCGKYEFVQTTSVKPQTINPVWNEYFDIPVSRDASHLAEAVENGCDGQASGLSSCWVHSFLGSEMAGLDTWGEIVKTALRQPTVPETASNRSLRENG